MASIRILFNRNATQTIKQLIHKNCYNSCHKNFRSIVINTKIRPNYQQINNNLIIKNSNNLNITQKCLFQTSPKRYNPLLAVVLRQVAKVVAIFTGRLVSN